MAGQDDRPPLGDRVASCIVVGLLALAILYIGAHGVAGAVRWLF